MARPPRWSERVNKPLTAAERQQVRTSVNQSKPFGDQTWVHRIAQKLRRHSSLRLR
jgi:putative transposase